MLRSSPVRVEAEPPPATPLEDRHQHAVGGADREQVHEHRLERHDHRAQHDEQHTNEKQHDDDESATSSRDQVGWSRWPRPSADLHLPAPPDAGSAARSSPTIADGEGPAADGGAARTSTGARRAPCAARRPPPRPASRPASARAPARAGARAPGAARTSTTWRHAPGADRGGALHPGPRRSPGASWRTLPCRCAARGRHREQQQQPAETSATQRPADDRPPSAHQSSARRGRVDRPRAGSRALAPAGVGRVAPQEPDEDGQQRDGGGTERPLPRSRRAPSSARSLGTSHRPASEAMTVTPEKATASPDVPSRWRAPSG